MRVRTEWLGKRLFEAVPPSGHPVRMDANEAAGGEGSAPTPLELVLIGLTGCMGVDVSMILEKMRLKADTIRFEAEAERRDEPPKAITHVKLTVFIDGEIPPNKAWRAVNLSLSKYCSVAHSLRAPIDVRLVLNGDEVSGGNDTLGEEN
ncbi:MAG: hypothetical protein BAA01_03220 [Bacillus thermozeamaize]|uniref:Peroxiredoxin n=1 Tax=Bacillus thermozeamaize TaxID=230954 RepID=A0A1Y3PRB5_9BACI|nr:MAG: hypothetical protein BAA01_03220 [Bacillus thermozeamaize]